MALFNNPAVLTEPGPSSRRRSLSINTCTPQGPAAPKAQRIRGDSSTQNVQQASHCLRPALVLLQTPGEGSACQRTSTLPGEAGRIPVPAYLADFMYGFGTWTINYCYAEQSGLTWSARSAALRAGAEVSALQTCSTAQASCIQAVIPLESSPPQRMRMSACYWGHLIMIIVSIFSCSPKAAAFINVPKRHPASFSGAMSTVMLEGCVLPLPASRDPLREERWATGCSATTSRGAGDWDAEEGGQEPGAWQDHAAFWQSRMEGI